jgi:hypothetical protein
MQANQQRILLFKIYFRGKGSMRACSKRIIIMRVTLSTEKKRQKQCLTTFP